MSDLVAVFLFLLTFVIGYCAGSLGLNVKRRAAFFAGVEAVEARLREERLLDEANQR